MFPVRYYGNRMFAPRYFPKIGAMSPGTNVTFISDAYYYDDTGATGSVSDGAVQDADVIYD